MIQTENDIELKELWGALRKAAKAAVFIDYDGIVEPYRFTSPQSGSSVSVLGLLDRISVTCRTEVVVITKRDARDLLPVFCVAPRPEIWGSGGLERLHSNGNHEVAALDRDLLEAFAAADSWLQAEGLRNLVTLKPNAIRINWGGLPEAPANEVRTCASRVLAHFGRHPALAICDGLDSLEVRIRTDRTARALTSFLDQLGPDSVAAYLGGPETDPECFRAMKDRGLSLLVSDFWKDSEADVWLHPPEELIRFLVDWVRACGGEL